jgi:uncharacterized protein YraI
MRAKHLVTAAALAFAAALPGVASAATAQALTDLNLRAGPGPNYDVVGVIDNNDKANVKGCIEGSLWCEVTYNGKTGWAYSKYLAMQRGPQTVAIEQHQAELGVPVVTYSGPAASAAAGAVTGALVAGPVGAAVGATVGAAAVPAIAPPPTVRTYVTEHRIDPVYLNGEVVVGAGVPETVALQPIPDYQYDYAYVNSVPVLVQPDTRRIVYVYR